eukprot:PhM_4_TR3591/c0_g1_i1/m.45030
MNDISTGSSSSVYVTRAVGFQTYVIASTTSGHVLALNAPSYTHCTCFSPDPSDASGAALRKSLFRTPFALRADGVRDAVTAVTSLVSRLSHVHNLMEADERNPQSSMVAVTWCRRASLYATVAPDNSVIVRSACGRATLALSPHARTFTARVEVVANGHSHEELEWNELHTVSAPLPEKWAFAFGFATAVHSNCMEVADDGETTNLLMSANAASPKMSSSSSSCFVDLTHRAAAAFLASPTLGLIEQAACLRGGRLLWAWDSSVGIARMVHMSCEVVSIHDDSVVVFTPTQPINADSSTIHHSVSVTRITNDPSAPEQRFHCTRLCDDGLPAWVPGLQTIGVLAGQCFAFGLQPDDDVDKEVSDGNNDDHHHHHRLVSQSIVPGLGVFRAWSNRSVQCRFQDRTIILFDLYNTEFPEESVATVVDPWGGGVTRVRVGSVDAARVPSIGGLAPFSFPLHEYVAVAAQFAWYAFSCSEEDHI